jgi:2-isopropylmalate synthase
VVDPPIARKIELLHAMAAIGVDVVSIGIPAAGERAARDTTALAAEIARSRLPLQPTAAARTLEADVAAVARVSERVGLPIAVYAFVASSPIRQYAEGWDLDFLVRGVATAGEAARRAGLPFCMVTEDTTRSPPATLSLLYRAAIDAGASGLCLCDTVGHASPHGTEALVSFTRRELARLGAPDLSLDWHGHDDRGLALANALAAVRCGVDRVHGTALGFGERTGNTRIDHLAFALSDLRLRPAPPPAALERYQRIAAYALGRARSHARAPSLSSPETRP